MNLHVGWQAILFTEDDFDSDAAAAQQQQLLSEGGYGASNAIGGGIRGGNATSAAGPLSPFQKAVAGPPQKDGLTHSARDTSLTVGDSVNELPNSHITGRGVRFCRVSNTTCLRKCELGGVPDQRINNIHVAWVDNHGYDVWILHADIEDPPHR